MGPSLSPLDALGSIAARLAAGDVAAAMPGVLEAAAAALGASGCGIWCLDERGALAHRWGDDAGDPGAIATRFATPATGGDGVQVVPLRAGGEVIGALTVRAPAASAGLLSPSVVADVIAPSVARAEQSARHSGEVAAHAAEAEAQRRFVERVVDSLPMGLYVIDRDYRIVLWNRKRETDTHGVARDEALGRSIFEVLTRQDASLMRGEFDDVLSTGEVRRFQMESRASGELRTYRLTKIPMQADDGTPSHVITVGEDVTEWRAALERTAQAEKLAAIGQLAAGVMHEINNPLATIAACAETMTLTLADTPARATPPGFGEYLRIVDHEVHRCRGIIDGLLNFSRAKPVQRVTLGVNAVVEQTLFLLKHHARFKRYPVRLELADGAGPAATVDPDQLIQVLMALLLNAADAIGEPDADADDVEPRGITVRTASDGSETRLEVSDDGAGIPRDDLSRIFDPFYTTKSPGEGTGLGLAICYGIVRDHGGRIEVESEVGVGSTFRVLLPNAT